MARKLTDLFPPQRPDPKELIARASHPNGGYYHDGMDGGAERCDDTDLDRMIYPQAQNHIPPSPWEAEEEKREHELHIERHQARMRSREFRITEGNVTGENPGPPSPWDRGEGKK